MFFFKGLERGKVYSKNDSEHLRNSREGSDIICMQANISDVEVCKTYLCTGELLALFLSISGLF